MTRHRLTSFDDPGTTGGVPNPYPGVFSLIQGWASLNGATGLQTDTQRTLDLIGSVGGSDTIVSRYVTAPAGGSVGLWSIQGGSHAPRLTTGFASSVTDWMLSRTSPQ